MRKKNTQRKQIRRNKINEKKRQQCAHAMDGKQHHVRYGGDVRFILTVVVVFTAPLLYIIVQEKAFAVLPVALLLITPAVLMMLYAFRFGVWFQQGKPELRVRKLFGSTKTIPLSDIQEIYTSTDGRAMWLNLVTKQGKIHVNTSACVNTNLLRVFLRLKKPNAFTPARTKKEYHLL
ncbi:MAG: hypothetical protein ACI4J3_03345 [Oscillospiraceae bacterium]